MSGPILCALDVSNDDQDTPVLKRAAQIAALDNAQLDMITVVPDYGNSWVGSYFSKDHHAEMEKGAIEQLSKLGEEVLGAEANAKVRHLVVTGNAYEEILRVAQTNGASMIVIGAHKPNFSDYLLGPNAARVVRHSKCSVMVVR